MTELPDQQLLRLFAEGGGEAPFAELVRRNVSLVYSAALRITRNSQMAEESTQTVFIALARQAREVAARVQRGAPLSAWLHLATRNIAANAVRAESRRRAREQEAAILKELNHSGGESDWEELAPQLDEALSELPDRDRHALLLRFFEKQTAREIGERLGLTQEAAQKRVSRALESLRHTLARRGLPSPTSALVAFLTAHALQAAPAGLAKAATASALAAAASTPALGLALSSFLMSKSQVAVSLALLAAIAIPFTQQRSTLASLREARNSVRFNREPAEHAAPTARPLAIDETAEIARLRSAAADLRERIAARRHAAPATLSPAPEPAQTLIQQGRKVAIAELEFAGNATPEAALQSLTVFRRDGELDRALAMTLFPPQLHEQVETILSDPEGREKMTHEMRASLFGLIRSETAIVSGPGAAPGEKFVRDIWPATLDGEFSIELAAIEQIDERRARLKAKITRGTETREQSFTFGRTSSGWKQLP